MITFQTTAAPALPGAPRFRRTRLAEMVDAMLELAFAGQTVDEDALGNRGFTRAEIVEHGRRARDLANQAAIRRVA